MAAITLVPAAEAAAFTLGCVFIHAQRRHAELLTEVLAVVAVTALLAIAFLTIRVEQLNEVAIAIEAADLGGSLPLPAE